MAMWFELRMGGHTMRIGHKAGMAVAAAVGLDQTAFDACLDVGRYRAFPAQAAQEARRAGATGTPTFFINGRPVSASYMAMSAMINAILEN